MYNGSTLEHNSNWFGKLQSKATTFLCPFLGIGHVTNLPTTHGMDSDKQNHHNILFLNFLVFWFSGYNVLVTKFGNVHRPCRHYFIIVNNGVYSFFLIFCLYLPQLPYWEMCTEHVINASRLSKESTSYLFFFPWFFLIFLLYLHELPY